MKTPISPVRCLLGLVLFLSIAVAPSTGAKQTTGDVTISVGTGVSHEDVSYVREGARLAQDYITSTLGLDFSSSTIINVRAGANSKNSDIVGFASGHAMMIYTGSASWLTSPPFLRVHVVVHEFLHVFGEKRIEAGSAAWLEEGMAEYLSFDALVDRGLVTKADAGAANTAMLAEDPPDAPLAEMESLEDFQQADGATYCLAYLAIEQLLADSPATAIADYTRGISEGAKWEDAFASAFGQDVSTFYAASDDWQAEMVSSSEIPPSFAPAQPLVTRSEVRILRAPQHLRRGDQIAFVARSEPNAVCTWTLTSESGLVLLRQRTFADGSGRLFWLWSVPDALRPGAANVSVTCGAPPESVNVTID